jgi:hypothetical protein
MAGPQQCGSADLAGLLLLVCGAATHNHLESHPIIHLSKPSGYMLFADMAGNNAD